MAADLRPGVPRFGERIRDEIFRYVAVTDAREYRPKTGITTRSVELGELRLIRSHHPINA